MPIIKLSPLMHRNALQIAIGFKFDNEVKAYIQQLDGVTWSQSHKTFYMVHSTQNKQRLYKHLKARPWTKDYSAMTANIQQPMVKAVSTKNKDLPTPDATVSTKVEKYIEWLRSKRYSESTVKTYSEALKVFFRFYKDKPLQDINNDDLIVFNNQYILKNRLSASYQNQLVNAIKLFFSKIENAKLDPELIHRPKRARLLPNVLSKEEVKAILEAHANIKHRTMLSLIYSCGLRRSELLHLKAADIDSKRNIVIIRQSKGRKDRIAPLDSTKYLIHPIGEYSMYESRGKYFGSSSYGYGSFTISNFNRYEITGNLHNLKFQQIDSETLTSLTTKNIRIKSVSFLRDIFDNTKKQILVYRVFDKDTNRDNELDDNDIETLYISEIDGTKFTKLTTEFQELIDWKVLKVKNRLYFRSIEDTNKNGEFDKEDKVHYQFVDFNTDKRVVNEYNPI